jgi:hypothetical protein
MVIGTLDGAKHGVQAEPTPDLLVERGPALADEIRAKAATGRPVWRIRSLYVPRVPYVAGPTNGRGVPVPRVGIPIGLSNIRNTVSATLAQREPWPHEWTPHELAQLRRLYIAALPDIVGIMHDPRDTRAPTIRDRDARKGRAEWASLGAWPWSLFGPDGAAAARWLDHELAIVHWCRWAHQSGD